jgi:Ca2+-binding EF-hand superfamily protein
MNKLSTLAAAAALALSMGAQAQNQPMAGSEAAPSRTTLEASFKQADKDSDGKLSKAEIAAMKGWAEKLAAADTDNDGLISMSEFMAAHGTK